MASYHCSVKTGGKGRAGKHSDYISRDGKYSPELTKGNSSKLEDLEHTASGNMPGWAEHDHGVFWRAADEHERANGATYREIEVALPRELNPAQRRELVEDFIQQQIGERHPYTYAIHLAKAAIVKGEQPLAHIMYSERTLDGIDRDPDLFFRRANSKAPEKGGCKKDSAGTQERLLATRALWATVQNKHLEQAGHDARVTHLSLKAQGIDRQPEKHLGPIDARKVDAAALLEYRAAERELSKLPQVDAAAELAALAQDAEADRQAQANQAAHEAREAQAQADREAARQAQEAALNAKLTAEAKEKEDDRIRAAALAALANSSRATGRALAFSVANHGGIAKNLDAAGGDLGRAGEGAERRVARSHIESSAPAVREQLEQARHLFQQLVRYLPRVVETIAAAAKAVTQREAARQAHQAAQEAREARRQAEAEAQREAAAQARQEAHESAEAKKKAINTKLTVAPLVDSPFDKTGLHRSDDLELVRRAQELFSQPLPDGYARHMLQRDISSAMSAAVREISDTEPRRHATADAERTIKDDQNAAARQAGQPEPWKAGQTACAWVTIAFGLERERREHLETKRPSGFFSGSAAKEYDAKTASLTSQLDIVRRATKTLEAELQAKLAAQAQQAAQRDPQRHAEAKERHEGLMRLHKAVGEASREIEAASEMHRGTGRDDGLGL